ncbi:DEAD/DEAH box helicase [Vagococcus salmoninarum]|uniref:DEAD/DEAH box helicase n=2 Tax=Vagococcus salmoninarum TaxID=2739 RepID=UPI003F9B516E
MIGSNKHSEAFQGSLRKAFINKKEQGSVFDPKLVINDKETKQYVVNDLTDELEICKTFFFSVAFVTQSGLNAIKVQLADLADKGIRGRLLTSNYLTFNSPDVYEDLLKIDNLDVRISSKAGFHSKGYLFEQENYYSLIVGSSNLTMNALKVNYEWNIRLTSLENGQIVEETKSFMENEWDKSRELTKEWIADYREIYSAKLEVLIEEEIVGKNLEIIDEDYGNFIIPNKMQTIALKNLRELRLTGANKGLIISATGTGKTYLSAFDVNQFKPKKMLFVVHREQILNKAKDDFQKIIGGNDSDYGILSGNKKEIEAKYVFATIQTVSKDKYLENFPKDYFDYILIDEVHKAGGQTYQKIIDYFEPEFLLGMTATPERTDSFDIFELFDYNVAYEIRLQEALEEDMLAPFHYFGVTDYERNGETIDEASELQFLVAEERVKYLLEKINYYGCSGNNPRGLVFCSRKEEVALLSRLFNEKGIPSTYLTGEHLASEREYEINRLENGEINYIFTVDIFNEGIDIPMLNQVIMLRNTKSSIIFVQQLGRGLRKHSSKKFVTIIDFIGNYSNNYMIPMALSGDLSRNKDNLRRDTFDVSYISGVSAVNFEKIAKEKIYQSIDKVSMNSMKELKRVFEQLENRLGRVPYLVDFYEQKALEPLIIANKLANYYEFLQKMKKAEGIINDEGNQFLMIASRELLSGFRRHELIILKALISNQKGITEKEILGLFEKEGIISTEKTLKSALNTLNLSFYTGQIAKSYASNTFIEERTEGIIELSDGLRKALANNFFERLFSDIIETGLKKNQEFKKDTALTLYKKYKRKDALRLLNWQEQMVDQNIGGYTYKDAHFVIFVTLDKGEDFKGAQMAYEDEFLDTRTMTWFTKAPRTLNSPEVKILKSAEEWNIHLFVKKSDDEGTDFYYLGEVTPIESSIKELEKKVQDGGTKKVVEVDLNLKQEIELNLYKYLNS